MATFSQLPSPAVPWVDAQGRPTTIFIQFVAALANGKLTLTSAADDAAAAKANVPVGGLYQAAGVVRVRLT